MSDDAYFRGVWWLALCLVAALVISGCDGGGDSAPNTAGATGSAQVEPHADPERSPGDPHPGATPEAPPEWEEAGYRTAFSFVDNRHLLHAVDSGLFIDFGHPSAYKYIQGRWRSPWQAGVTEGDDTVAWTDGISATFRFPLVEVTGDMELQLQMQTAESGQFMDVFVNSDRALTSVRDASTDLSVVSVALPADRLVVGENKVRFHFNSTARGTAGGFDWARILPAGADVADAHQDGAFSVGADNQGRPTLDSPAYGGYSVYLTVPETGRLRVRVTGTDDLPAEITLDRDGAATQSLWTGTATPAGVPVEVDLAEHVNEVVRINLRGTGGVRDLTLSWSDPIIAVTEGDRRELGEIPTRVFVWLVDTLRWDKLSHYNPDTVVSAPNMVGFSDQCINFRRVSVQGNSSLPASASIHTSSYPTVHHIVDGETRISRDLENLGAPFEAADWNTGLLSANGYVTQSRGFGRDYDEYHNLIHNPGRPDSENLWPIARDWIEGWGDAGWYLFINTIDPHVPYDPPADILAQYHPNEYSGRIRPRATGELLDSLGGDGMNEADLRYLLALHHGEITYNDIWFGTALEALTELGQLEDTLVVILSDHGEAFMEHGRVGHGSSVYEEVTRIPMMLCHPRSLGTGWVDTEVESIDLYPTLTALLGLTTPDSVQGISVLDLILDDTPTMNRPNFTYHQEYMRGMRIGRWKYILRTGDQDNLYDLNASEIEGDDQRADYPIAHRYMRDVMAFHLAFDTEWQKSSWGFANDHSPDLAERLDTATW